MRTERWRGPARARGLDERALLRLLGDHSLDACWERLSARPYLIADVSAKKLDSLAPRESERVLAAATRAAERQLDLLGTGPSDSARPATGTST